MPGTVVPHSLRSNEWVADGLAPGAGSTFTLNGSNEAWSPPE
jgi:hypothetical protein